VVDSEGNLLLVRVHAADVLDGEGARLGQRQPALWADSRHGGPDLARCVREELGAELEIVRRPLGQRSFMLRPRRGLS